MLKRYVAAVCRIILYTDCSKWAGMEDYYFIDYFNGKFQFDQCYGCWGGSGGVSGGIPRVCITVYVGLRKMHT